MTKSKYNKLSYLDKQDVDWILNEVINSPVYPKDDKIKAKEMVKTFARAGNNR